MSAPLISCVCTKGHTSLSEKKKSKWFGFYNFLWNFKLRLPCFSMFQKLVPKNVFEYKGYILIHLTQFNTVSKMEKLHLSIKNYYSFSRLLSASILLCKCEWVTSSQYCKYVYQWTNVSRHVMHKKIKLQMDMDASFAPYH